MANKHRPWWCDVFEQQRITLGYDAEETATHANGALDDDRMIDAEGYAAIERGDVQPDIDVFEAIAGALWLDVKVDAQLELRLELTIDPTLMRNTPHGCSHNRRRCSRPSGSRLVRARFAAGVSSIEPR
jgi:transcriptional regulator with XRE-family HTH domain